VRAEVFDASGRLVRVLVDGVLNTGRHEQGWDRRDQSGVRVPAGIYFVRLDAGGKGSRQKVVVLS
ncbi:MAG: T9SS type A sorting domain-containing protein, partial [Candidatus Eisenbacteria bacterium]|nr:T9SS type A sorting domain-containing protein [Candidatus Eisenbacteria bacterium]